ncbi:hypothetical protein [Bartonella sp. DGB2]|uniref:hypothetical protein n=1 Tax=Bartonella sp. DGB2 TaxID=3388426 RepID=UPI00398FBCBD
MVFVDNVTALALLAQHLSENYPIITSQEQDYAQKFRSAESGILPAHGDAAKGLNLQFCSFVINYDLLYDAVDLEQRISRRQGQMRNVIVVNFMCQKNIDDVRTLELINKRTLQFDSIFGRSDEILGQFISYPGEIAAPLRGEEEIKQAFRENLSVNEDTNTKIIEEAEALLFTSFTQKVAENATITPQYIQEQAQNIQEHLWHVVKSWFATLSDYKIDEDSQTIRYEGDEPPSLFYYYSGARSRLYKGKKLYGLRPDFKPASQRITLLNPLVKGILLNMACSDHGELIVNEAIEPCTIGYYCVEISSPNADSAEYYILTGQRQSGEVLDHQTCEKIFKLPIVQSVQQDEPAPRFVKNTI